MTTVATVALVGEDTAHAVLLATLLRGSICEVARERAITWVVDQIEHDPCFLGPHDLGEILSGVRYTNSIEGLQTAENTLTIQGRPVKLRGHLGGQPLAPEAQKWRRLLVGVLALEPSGVMIARDTDGEPARLQGLRQVVEWLRQQRRNPAFVIAAPHQDAECWFVAGFDTEDTQVQGGMRSLRVALKFDPVRHPERLTAHPNDAPTDAKRVLRTLLGLEAKSRPLDPDELRKHQERLLGDLERLPRNGLATGLTEFLREVREDFVRRLFPGL
ncbi:MAG: hypothetical protein HY909_03185 [Deltaproteobacteria bacterium]|nr:hypothetical protein [Deltaproteobacteria bacterium]